METMERKQPRARRSFTPEFKAEIVGLCQRVIVRSGGSPATSI
jgi:transposase-like protein